MLGITLLPIALERSTKVELLTLVGGTPCALNTELGVAKEMRRIGHDDAILDLLREGKNAGDIGYEGVKRFVGDRRVLEVEEANVHQSMTKLIDEGRMGGGIGQEGIIQNGDGLKVDGHCARVGNPSRAR